MSEKTDYKPRITVCIPMRGSNPSFFTYDLVNMYAHTAVAFAPDTADLGILTVEGTYIHTNRNDLAEQALKAGCDYILWLDDDMRFPKDTLLRLLRRRKKIIGANYPTRKAPFVPVAIASIEGRTKHMPKSDEDPLTPVEAIGFGVALTHTEVFNSIRYPWFENNRDRENDRWVGEDVDFCMKAREAGYEVFVDNELSAEVAHIGTFEYRMVHAQAIEEAEKEYGDHDLHGVADGDSELAQPA